MPARGLHIAEDGFVLPRDWLTLSTVVYGSSGSGKTVFGKVCAEEAHKAGVRFCIVDIKGDYYGLKSSADGNKDGIPVVIVGGDHAELPLAKDKDKLVEQARFLAELIAGSEHSFILDLEHLSKGKQIAFLGTFFERLYEVNRDPLLLIMDEAQRYAPQKPMPGIPMETLGAVEDIVKLGRKHGIGRMLLTQRGSGLSKETSEICDMMVAFRTPGTLDQGRAKDWLNANVTKIHTDEVMPLISGLDTGQAIFASNHPDLRRGKEPMIHLGQVRRSETFDSSATPRIGKRKLEPKRLAKADLEALTAKMQEYIEEAEANDPKKLQAEMARLKRELAKREKEDAARIARMTEQADRISEQEDAIAELMKVLDDPLIEMHQVIPVGLPEEVETLIKETLVLRDGVMRSTDGLDRCAAKLQRHLDGLRETGAAIEELENPKPYSDTLKRNEPTRRAGMIVKGGKQPPNPPPPARGVSRPPAPPRGSGSRIPPLPPERKHVSMIKPPVLNETERATLSGPQRKVLDSVAWWASIGIDQPSKQQVGIMAGYRIGKKISGNYSNVLGQLRTMELIDYPEGNVSLTETGRTMAQALDIEPTTEALQSAIFARLRDTEKKVLRVYVDAYPEALDKLEAGARAGYTLGDKVSGNYSNMLGRLHTLDLIEYPTRGFARASDVLFLD